MWNIFNLINIQNPPHEIFLNIPSWINIQIPWTGSSCFFPFWLAFKNANTIQLQSRSYQMEAVVLEFKLFCSICVFRAKADIFRSISLKIFSKHFTTQSRAFWSVWCWAQNLLETHIKKSFGGKNRRARTLLCISVIHMMCGHLHWASRISMRGA